MKLLCIGLYILPLFHCNLVQKQSTGLIQSNYKINDSSNIYKVIKIDTIKNINIIFAKKNELTYKIMLVQDSIPCLNKSIKIGQCYNLVLKSVFPDNYQQRDRISVYRFGSARIKLERNNGILWDLFYIQNIRELCNQLDLKIGFDTLALFR